MSTQPVAAAPIERVDIQVGEHSLHVNRAGERTSEAVLLLHGSGPGATALSNWQLALPVLGERFQCFAPDLLGYGDSSHPDPAPGSMREWTRARCATLFALLDELELERVHVIGNSMGGRIALEMLMLAPERFDRVVLMGASGAPVEVTPELQRLIYFFENPTPEAMGQLISWFSYETGLVGDDLKRIAEERLEAATRADVRRSFTSTWTPPFDMVVPPTALRRMTHPVLLVHGADDAFVPLAASEYMAEHLPNFQMHVFGKTGHWVQIEQAQAFNQIVSLFLAGELG
jgi:2-hydroxymuconate-semialdehyde hydrolase